MIVQATKRVDPETSSRVDNRIAGRGADGDKEQDAGVSDAPEQGQDLQNRFLFHKKKTVFVLIWNITAVDWRTWLDILL